MCCNLTCFVIRIMNSNELNNIFLLNLYLIYIYILKTETKGWKNNKNKFLY
jgi:hypothetical protein